MSGGEENGLTPKEAYEARREERSAARAAAPARSGSRLIRRLVWWLIAVAILAGLGYWIWSVAKANSPVGEDYSTPYPIIGQDHIAEDSPRPQYNSNPPTSGPHYGIPARVGFYEKEFPDERIVHNLEHGDIWISYRADISTSTRNALRLFADNKKVIVTLRPEGEWDIAVAAWGRLDGFNIAGESISESELQRIKDFILRYQNKGPEKVINSDSHLPS